MIDLGQLQCFVRVAELGGFTKAATVLSLKQPTISRKVRQLEIELRRNLLFRDGRGVRLTGEGAIFLAHAKGILEQAARAREDMADYKASPTGKVIIGTSNAAGAAAITAMVTTFKRQFPKAALELITMRDWTIYEWLSLGRVDIAILCDPPASPAMEVIKLRRRDLFLVMPVGSALPKSRKISFRQLNQFPLILPGEPHTLRVLLETTAAKLGITLNVALQIEGGDFILDLVRHGQGCAILTKDAVENCSFADRLQMHPIVSPRLARTLALAISTRRPVTHLTQETVKLIRTCFESTAKNSEPK